MEWFYLDQTAPDRAGRPKQRLGRYSNWPPGAATIRRGRRSARPQL